MSGDDCRTTTFNKVLNAFSKNWPDDLAWPADVPRPDVDYRFCGNDKRVGNYKRAGNGGRGDNYKRVGNGDDGGSM